MSKKLSPKTLSIVFVALLAFVVVIKLVQNAKGDKSSNYRSQLLEIDTANLTKIIITPHADIDREIEIVKTDDAWMFYNKGKEYKADARVVEAMINELGSQFPTKRQAARNDSKWAKYEVTDSLGIRVKIEVEDELVADMIIGKFDYKPSPSQNPYQQQQQGIMTTFVRLSDEDETYAIDGFLSMTFNKEVNGLRNKSLVRANKNDLSKLNFSYPADSSFTMIKNNDKWMVNGVLADSTEVDKYLNMLTYLTSSSFVDNNQATITPSHQITIEGNNMTPIQIKAFPADSVNQYIITSLINEDAKFSGAQEDLFKKAFISPSNLTGK